MSVTDTIYLTDMVCGTCGFVGLESNDFWTSETPGERVCPTCGSNNCYMTSPTESSSLANNLARRFNRLAEAEGFDLPSFLLLDLVDLFQEAIDATEKG